MKRLAGIVALLSLLCLPLPGRAEEKILLFSSTATLHPDSVLEVREEITVNVEWKRILHGIYRDFPTAYRDALGRIGHADFTVERVLLDGGEIPYRVELRTNHVRVYIGNPNKRVSPGKRTFTLVYSVTDQIEFFSRHDALDWNVTGNDWEFPIDEARFSLSLPGDAAFHSVEFSTGWLGARGRNARLLPDNSVVTTAPLPPGEGLTVVSTWPKGIVSPPKKPFFIEFFWKYHLLFVVALPFILLYVYLVLWFRWGKDPPMPVVIPLFSPPPGRTPGFLRYVSRMGIDDACFSSEILNLAVKGYILIKKRAPGENTELPLFSLVRTPKPPPEAPGSEKTLLNALFGRGNEELVLQDENRAILERAKDRLERLFCKEQNAFFSKNTRIWRSALPVPVFGWLLLSALGQKELAAASAFMTTVLGVACYFAGSDLISSGALRRYEGSDLLSYIAARLLPEFLIGMLLTSLICVLSLALLAVVLFLIGLGSIVVFFAGAIRLLFSLFTLTPLLVVLSSFAMAVIILIFHELMTIRTPEGNAVLAEAEGLIMYMETAERRRLEMFNPPQDTPEVYEALLPYAFALDVAETWAHRFDGILKEAQYAPEWCEGSGAELFNDTSVFSIVIKSLPIPTPGGMGAAAKEVTNASGSGSAGFFLDLLSGFVGRRGSGGGRGGGGGGGW